LINSKVENILGGADSVQCYEEFRVAGTKKNDDEGDVSIDF